MSSENIIPIKRRKVGPQFLIDWVHEFQAVNGREPRRCEIPCARSTLQFYFGGFKNLLEIANFNNKPFRDPRKKRYCRYCGEELPPHRYFFCPPIHFKPDPAYDAYWKVSCAQGFEHQNSMVLTLDEAKKVDKVAEGPAIKLWKKCRTCPHDCNIWIPKTASAPSADVICQADPRYREFAALYGDEK